MGIGFIAHHTSYVRPYWMGRGATIPVVKPSRVKSSEKGKNFLKSMEKKIEGLGKSRGAQNLLFVLAMKHGPVDTPF